MFCWAVLLLYPYCLTCSIQSDNSAHQPHMLADQELDKSHGFALCWWLQRHGDFPKPSRLWYEFDGLFVIWRLINCTGFQKTFQNNKTGQNFKTLHSSTNVEWRKFYWFKGGLCRWKVHTQRKTELGLDQDWWFPQKKKQFGGPGHLLGRGSNFQGKSRCCVGLTYPPFHISQDQNGLNGHGKGSSPSQIGFVEFASPEHQCSALTFPH